MPEVINSFRGDAQAKAQVERWVIVGAEVGETWTATVNRKEVTYTLTQDDIDAAPSLTIDQVAMTNLLAALAAGAEDIAEFNEMTYESDDGDDGIEAILVTGPDDGKPFTATLSNAIDSSIVVTVTQQGVAGKNEKQYVALATGVAGGTFTLDFGGQVTTAIAYDATAYDVRDALCGLSNIAGTDEVQTLTITGTPTGGDFTITYSGQTTAAIAYNANAAAVQSALEALSNIAVGEVTCAGGALPGTPVTITFHDALGRQNVALSTADGAGLTGGTAPDAAIATTTAGVASDVTVTGADGGPWTVEFVEALAETNVAAMIGNGAALDVGGYDVDIETTQAALASGGLQNLVASATYRSANDLMGTSVGIDSNAAIAGAPGIAPGEAFVFSKTSQWAYQARLAGDETAVSGAVGFGCSVAVYGDTAVVGAYGHRLDADGADDREESGAVYVYTKSGQTWSLQQKIVSSGPSGRVTYDRFGFSVAIYADTIVVGSPRHGYDPSGSDFIDEAGAVYVFIRAAGVWSLQQKLVGSGTNGRKVGDKFGWSVAVDVDTIVVGAPFQDSDDAGANHSADAGAAYVFLRTTGSWALQQKIVGSGHANNRLVGDNFGTSVDVDGDTAIIGAPYQDYDATGANAMTNSGAAYVFLRTAGTWALQQKVVGSGHANNRLAGDLFGWSVAVDGNRAVVGAYGQDYDAAGGTELANAGAAFILTRSGATWSLDSKIVGTGTNGRTSAAEFGYAVALSGTSAAVGARAQAYDELGANYLGNAGALFVSSDGQNEIQEVTIAGVPAGGTFTLTFDSETTAAINYNASAVDVQLALEALATPVPGDVSVTGPNGGPWLVEFTGAYALTDVVLMTGDGTNLTGASVTVSTLQGGLAPVNEIQSIAFDESPDGGTFTLSFAGQTTTAIVYNATASAVDSALEALSNIGAGDVTCTGGPLPTLPIVVTFGSALAATNIETITGDGDLLTGSGNSEVTQATSQAPTGPNWGTEAENWTLGHAPTTGETMLLENSTVSLLYGLDFSNVNIAKYIQKSTYTGEVGLKQHTGLYYEYRNTELLLGFDEGGDPLEIEIGEGSGSGSGLTRINTADRETVIDVYTSSTSVDGSVPAINWRGTHADNVIRIQRGKLGIGYFYGQAATVSQLWMSYQSSVSSDAEVTVGADAEVCEVYKTGGALICAAGLGTLNNHGGDTILRGTGEVAVIDATAGVIFSQTTGTLGQYGSISGITQASPAVVTSYSSELAIVLQEDSSGESFVTETTDANDAGAGDWDIFPAGVGADDACYFGLAQRFGKLAIDLGTAGAGTYTVTWEYWDGDEWVALAGISDGTTAFKAGTSSYDVTWTAPGLDWKKTSVNSSADLYFVRARRNGGTVSTDPVGDSVRAFVPHGLSNGHSIRIADVVGMLEVNQREFTIQVVDAYSFQLIGLDSTGYTAYSSAGTWGRVGAVQLALAAQLDFSTQIEERSVSAPIVAYGDSVEIIDAQDRITTLTQEAGEFAVQWYNTSRFGVMGGSNKRHVRG